MTLRDPLIQTFVVFPLHFSLHLCGQNGELPLSTKERQNLTSSLHYSSGLAISTQETGFIACMGQQQAETWTRAKANREQGNILM